MRMIVTASFKGAENRAEVEGLCALVRDAGFEDFCFVRDVENYQKVFDHPRALMLRARDEIARSDALLIDMTAKPTGRAIEAGIAFAQGKRIVMIMQHGTVIKDTSRGIADALIEYDILEDIVSPLRQLHANWDTRPPDDRHPQH